MSLGPAIPSKKAVAGIMSFSTKAPRRLGGCRDVTVRSGGLHWQSYSLASLLQATNHGVCSAAGLRPGGAGQGRWTAAVCEPRPLIAGEVCKSGLGTVSASLSSVRQGCWGTAPPWSLSPQTGQGTALTFSYPLLSLPCTPSGLHILFLPLQWPV